MLDDALVPAYLKLKGLWKSGRFSWPISDDGNLMHDLRELIAFRTIVLTGGFNAAARQLKQTPATLSRSIARLEEELGVRLFHRTTRSVSVTSEGQSYFESIEPAMQQILAARDSVATLSRQPSGLVRIQVSSIAARMMVLPALPLFLKTYPDIELQITSAELGVDLIKENIDIALHFGPCIDCNYISLPLAKAPVYLMASPNYLERHGTPKNIPDLSKHNFVNGKIKNRPVAWRFVKTQHGKNTESENNSEIFIPKGNVFFDDSFSLTMDAALEGIGIIACDSITALSLMNQGSLKIILPEYSILGMEDDATYLRLSYPDKNFMPLRVKIVRDFISDLWHSTKFRSFDPHKYAA